MRRSKYPSLGILDALDRLVIRFLDSISKSKLYDSLNAPRPSRIEYSKMLDSLSRNGYINKSEDAISITKKGIKKASTRFIENITLSKVKDGYPRLIAFDIPEKMRHARDVIRLKLKEFECVKIQKSLYQTPYVCEKEIDEICQILNIKKFVHVLKLAKTNFSR